MTAVAGSALASESADVSSPGNLHVSSKEREFEPFMVVTRRAATVRGDHRSHLVKKFAIAAASFAALSGGSLGWSGPAAALPSGGSASDTIAQLQAEGYQVQVNGTVNTPLSQCRVLEVSGLRGTESGGVRLHPAQLDTAFVDVSCPSHD
jgi:hypothetical protein